MDVRVNADNRWVEIDPDETYGIVTNNYVRTGGDGYAMFASDGIDAYDFGPNLEDVVAAYIANHRPYNPYTDGRISKR